MQILAFRIFLFKKVINKRIIYADTFLYQLDSLISTIILIKHMH